MHFACVDIFPLLGCLLGNLVTHFFQVPCSIKLPDDDDAATWLGWMTTAATVCHAPSPPPPLKHASQRPKVKMRQPVQVLQKRVHERTNRECKRCEQASRRFLHLLNRATIAPLGVCTYRSALHMAG
ncbi:hypothetical protein CGRA01v4_04969 [Colletotrichum graminicola]|nr:hypothetical protein CGRA01v4_04969 [Colletotrichum graminicola]